MSLKDFKYKVIFSSTAKAIIPQDDYKSEIKASLETLKNTLPIEVDGDDPAVLYIAGDLAVAGVVNANDDAITRGDAIQIYKKFKGQQCNIEHDREKVVGYIVWAGLSEYGTSRVISEEEAINSGKPFNITTIAALWKVVNKPLCAFIIESSNPESPNYEKLSLSFEVGFDDQAIAFMPKNTKNIDEATIYQSSSMEYSELLPLLRAEGGSGVKNGHPLARVVKGEIVPLGQGIVTVPAANVKGITAILETEEPEKDEKDEEDNDKEEESKIKAELESKERDSFQTLLKDIVNNIKILENSVLTNITRINLHIQSDKNMKLKSLEEIVAKVNAAEKLEDVKTIFASDIVSTIALEIAKASEELINKENEAKAKADEAKAKADQLALDNTKLAEANTQIVAQLEELKIKLNNIEAAEQAKASEQAFQERVAEINDTFELDDETRAFVLDEVKTLDTEAFAKFMKKAKVTMKEKTKAFMEDKKKEAKYKKNEMVASLQKAGIKVSLKEDELDFEQIMAGAVGTDSTLPNNIDSQTNTTLADEVKQAFGGKSMKIGGKTLEQIEKSNKKVK